MRILTFFFFFYTSVSAQTTEVNDLFKIFYSTRERADSLVKARGLVPLKVDLKSGKALEVSGFFTRDEQWSEHGEQILFEYRHPSTAEAFGFSWDRKKSRVMDAELVVLKADSLEWIAEKRNLFELDAKIDGDKFFTNSTRDVYLWDTPGINNSCRMIILFRKDSPMLLPSVEKAKVKKKKK